MERDVVGAEFCYETGASVSSPPVARQVSAGKVRV